MAKIQETMSLLGAIKIDGVLIHPGKIQPDRMIIMKERL